MWGEKSFPIYLYKINKLFFGHLFASFFIIMAEGCCNLQRRIPADSSVGLGYFYDERRGMGSFIVYTESDLVS